MSQRSAVRTGVPEWGDVLSQVLASCRSERATTAHFALAAPWAYQSSGVEGLLIRVSTGAPYWVAAAGQPMQQVSEHDIVLLAQGCAHTLASAPDVPVQPIAPLIAQHLVGVHGEHPLSFRVTGAGAGTELFSLHLWMPKLGEAALLAALPPLMVLRHDRAPGGAALAQAAVALIQESFAQQPGWQLAAARLADLLLAQVLRHHLLCSDAAAAGWLQALRDPALARVLPQLHAQPEQDWSLARMAAAGHVSRTVFSERFRRCLGTTPMNYLGGLRMALAAERLCLGHQSLAQVAESVGYESEKAFARAFRRWAGEMPSAYVRQRVGVTV